MSIEIGLFCFSAFSLFVLSGCISWAMKRIESLENRLEGVEITVQAACDIIAKNNEPEYVDVEVDDADCQMFHRIRR